MFQVYQMFHHVFVLSTLSGFTHDSELRLKKIDLMKHLMDLMKHLMDLMKHLMDLMKHLMDCTVLYCLVP